MATPLTPADIARLLDVAESTVRGWEAGRSISAEHIAKLETLFGVAAPTRPEASDMAELIRAIRDLVEEMRLARERDQDAAAAMVRAAEVLLAARQPGEGGASTEPAAPLGSRR